MPHDPELIAEIRSWLVKARDDLEAAHRCLEGGKPLTSIAAFHAQQATEKSFKAFLTFHSVDFEKTHNLEVLGQKCVAVEAGLEPVSRAVAFMTGYAIEPRYPGTLDDPDEQEDHRALELAHGLVNAILTLLPDAAKT